jgi:hypothetical protein
LLIDDGIPTADHYPINEFTLKTAFSQKQSSARSIQFIDIPIKNLNELYGCG